MSHPPVPPSLKFFQVCEDGSIDFCFNGYPFCIGKTNAFVLAAVAEVEWRKRAERWQELALCYSPDGRGALYWAYADVAESNIRAWRAWGESK